MPISPDIIFSFLTHAARLKLSLAMHHGLSLREFLVLGIIATQGPATFKQLHELLSISKSAVTGLIDSLYERRLVDRQQDSEDRRRWFVALTNPGKQLVQSIQEADTRLLGNALHSLEDSEQAGFLKAAEAVAKATPDAPIGRLARRRLIRRGRQSRESQGSPTHETGLA